MNPSLTDVLRAKWGMGLLLIIGGLALIVHWHPPGVSVSEGRSEPEARAPAVIPLTSDIIDKFTVTTARIEPLSPDMAIAANSKVPLSKKSSPAAEPYVFRGKEEERARALSCLAAAELYEAGGSGVGQRAVAQVVLNRLRHPAFPKTICGVVFQGSERSSGCQFTFTCDGAMARRPPAWAWGRALKIATEALNGAVFAPVGYATHYHADWVVPYWSSTLDKIAVVQTHLFFRWPGAAGQPAAFRWKGHEQEPFVANLAALAAAHTMPHLTLNIDALQDSLNMPAHSPVPAPITSGSRSAGPSEDFLLSGVKVIVRASVSNIFILQLPDRLDPARYPDVGRQICKDVDECTVMAWKDNDVTPSSLPLPQGATSTMIFNYVQDKKNGSHRNFWNCRILHFPKNIACL